jgi:hypothetical protein
MALSHVSVNNYSALKGKFERIKKLDETPMSLRAENLNKALAEGGTVTKLDQLRVGIIEAYILADTIAKAFCVIDSVKQGQLIVYRTPAARQNMEFYKIANYNGKPIKGYTSQDKQAYAETYFISSDIIEIPKWNNIFTDNAAQQEDRANRDLAYSLEKYIDDDLTDLVDNQYVAAWRADTFQFQDTRVTGLPAGNIIDCSSEGEINLEVIKKILEHFIKLGRRVEAIYYPMDDIRNIWDWQAEPDTTSTGSLGKDLIPQYIQEQIWTSGVVKNLFGYPVNMVPCNTLASGTIKVIATPAKANDPAPRGAAFFWTVPMDSYVTDVPPVTGPMFRGLVMMMGMGMLALPQQCLNTARVDYK